MRLAIVEDNEILRESLRLLLSGEKDIDVVGAFASAEEALEGIASCRPDIILVDLGLPSMSGVELIDRIKKKFPFIEMMAHTIHEDRESVFSAIKAGASGYLLKGSSPREIIESLHCLQNGGAPMSPQIARKVIREFQETGIDEQFLLSQREKDILKGLDEGLAYKQIADRFSISFHTVHSHIKKIYEKLEAKSKQDALMKAKRKSII